MNLAGKRICIGLSGGVDSAVSAALLKEAGAQVTGVFIKGWYPPGLPCTWAEDRRDAMRVAAHLRIPFETLDAANAYKESVIDYLLDEYRAGRTPNPDVMCNRDVKFGAFHAYARERGAEHIATGHYARSEGAAIYRALDSKKDQTYFLWAVPRTALADAVFPLGMLKKEAVRVIAKRYDLPVAEKPDSQGICFLGPISVEDFLRSEFGAEPGAALDETGAIVGMHEGAILYTPGERVRLAGAASGPWYVLAKDMRTNIVTVARTVPEKAASSIRFEAQNWLSERSGTLSAQYRYHGPQVAGRVEGNAFFPSETLREPVAAGQSLVLYRGDELIGGGIISG